LNLKYITKDGGRPPITEAISKTIARYVEGHDCVGHVLPPRVGKSSIIRGCSLELGAVGAPFVLCLCPWKNLADQLAMRKKTQDFLRHYGVVLEKGRVFSTQSITKIPDGFFYQKEGGTPTLMACTIGLAANAALEADGMTAPLIEAIGTAKREAKMRPVIIVDEIQVVGNGQAWGKLIHRLRSAGAFIVTMTGTEHRADRDLMPGFEFKLSKDEPKSRTIHTRIRQEKDEDGNLVNVIRPDEYASVSGTVTPIGGVGIHWNTAFQNGWMLRTNVIQIDTEELVNGEQVKLSEMPKAVLAGKLGKILREEKTIAKGAEILLKRLRFWRLKTKQRAQALVITGSDSENDPSADWHARECRRVIERELDALGFNGPLSDLKIEIVTSNTEGSAADKISDFVNGDIDILIVKMMGLVGLDVPACMVTLNLSTVRNGPLAKQANSRHLTPWDGVTCAPADLIVPWDVLAQEMVAELAGSGGVVETWELETAGEEYSKPVEDKPVDQRTTEDAMVAGYADEIGGESPGDQEAILYAIKLRYATATLTDPEIMDNYHKGGFVVDANELAEYQRVLNETPEVVDLTELAKKKRGQFGKRANKYANEISPYSRNPEKYRETVINLQAMAKSRAGFRGNLVDVDDPHLLQRLMDALDEVYLEARG